jgi:uncharacterized protein YjlB
VDSYRPDRYIDLEMELTRTREGVFSAILPDDGIFPNSRLPLLVYPGALDEKSEDLAPAFERLFTGNSWGGTWRNGIYSRHHYHSTAHEVLGICGGSGLVQLGGESGLSVRVRPGDCILIPAGVAHKLLERTTGFLVVGAYPAGQSLDVCYGRPGERPLADRRIEGVPLPVLDPVRGECGPLLELWGVGSGGGN